MSHKDGRVVLSAWVEPVLRDYAREAAKAAGVQFSLWVEGAVQRAVAEQSAAKALRIYPVHASNLTDVVALLEDERDKLRARLVEAQAEVERLRERSDTQEDGLRYGEQVCADLMAQVEGLRGKLDVLATAHERDLVTIWHEATDAAHPPGSVQEVVEAVRSLRQERNVAHEAIAEWRRKVEKTEDQANANARKIDKLVSERRQLRARLVECRPWVGVCPFPNTAGFSEMLAIRDLADDTLEEVQP